MFVNRTRVLQISFLAILSAFVVEFVFGLFENSLALITDSVHALLDSVVTLILLLAAKMAIKPPDEEHTYGHGKIESLGGLLGGIAIFLISIFFIFESIQRLQHPASMLPGIFAIVGGLYTIGVDVFRIVLLRKSLRKIGGNTLRADFYHAFLDLGSTLVAIGGIILVSFGFHSGDFIAALILGVMLAILSVKLIHKTAQELTDIISPELVKEVKNIVMNTEGVIKTNALLMRRSGDTIFADVTISLRGDTSFEQAHNISSKVENNIKMKIPNAEITIHFEPNWENVPLDAKIYEIVNDIEGVRGVHNIISHKTNGIIFANLHVMVDREINLDSAHKISEIVERKIQKKLPKIEHVTVHLEPFVTVPENFNIENKETEKQIRNILDAYVEVKEIGRIISLNFEDIQKIDIDCSFDKELSIEKVHDLTSEIEHVIRMKIKNAVITIHPEPI